MCKKAGAVLLFVGVCAGLTALVMLLWNALIPAIVGWAPIGFWQALGLMLLCRLLFGGFGRHMHGHFCGSHDRRRMKEFRAGLKGLTFDQRRDFIRNCMTGKYDPCDCRAGNPDAETESTDKADRE